MSANRNLFDILEIDEKSELSAIKKAFRVKALELHPDKHLGEEAVYTEKFKELNSAWQEYWETLNKPKSANTGAGQSSGPDDDMRGFTRDFYAEHFGGSARADYFFDMRRDWPGRDNDSGLGFSYFMRPGHATSSGGVPSPLTTSPIFKEFVKMKKAQLDALLQKSKEEQSKEKTVPEHKTFVF